MPAPPGDVLPVLVRVREEPPEGLPGGTPLRVGQVVAAPGDGPVPGGRVAPRGLPPGPGLAEASWRGEKSIISGRTCLKSHRYPNGYDDSLTDVSKVVCAKRKKEPRGALYLKTAASHGTSKLQGTKPQASKRALLWCVG